MGRAQDEMVEGYLDGLDPDSPPPSGNRSLAYAHGFQSGRDDLARKPSAPAGVRRRRAEEILVADDSGAPEPCQAAQ
jgi:hypothetical protein